LDEGDKKEVPKVSQSDEISEEVQIIPVFDANFDMEESIATKPEEVPTLVVTSPTAVVLREKVVLAVREVVVAPPREVVVAPLREVVVSVFAELAARQAGEPAGRWRLVWDRPDRHVAAFSWLGSSLLLLLTLGDRLPPRKGRKSTAGRRVEHWTVASLAWRSLHLDPSEALTEEDQCITEAHESVTRRFGPARLATDCPNTYSLSALLQRVSAYTAPAALYLDSLNSVRRRFYPFSVRDGVVIFGQYLSYFFSYFITCPPQAWCPCPLASL
jgi:hypothetical protein